MIRFNRLKGFDYTKYTTYADIETFILNTNCQTHELGLSGGGNMIYGLSVGDLSKPMILIDGGMHGAHEWRCTHWVKEFIERINNPVDDVNKPLIKKIKSKFCFFVVPCLNSYGYLGNHYVNENGVNLNRNFPIGWDTYPTTVPFDEQYKGAAPFSEPQSQILQNLMNTYKVIGYVNCHTWGAENLGGIFETSSTSIELRTILTDIKDSLQLSIPECALSITTKSTPTVPWVTEWTGSTNSKCGKNVFSLIFETGGAETDYMKAELGMTGLFVFCYYVHEWFKTRRVIL